MVFLTELAPANLQKCVRDCATSTLEDFAGNFPGGFFWALFPRERGEEMQT